MTETASPHDRKTTPPTRWLLTPFAQLSVAQLYAVLQLRSEVFVVEQNCVFQDMDGADAQAVHLLGFVAQDDGGQEVLVAYARLVPPGVKFDEASIGRVITRASARGTGLGHTLIREALAGINAVWGPQAIRIGAQSQLIAFYRRHGFEDLGKPYLEDGIPHAEMLRQASDPAAPT